MMTQAEKRGGRRHPESLLQGFNSALDDCGLIDLGMKGLSFTWEKSRGTHNWLEERLDRAVATADWCLLHASASVTGLRTTSSDHAALFLDTKEIPTRRAARSFRFEMAWLRDEGCDKVVNEAWLDSCAYDFCSRLAICGQRLQSWGGERMDKFGKDIHACKRRLEQINACRDEAALAEIRTLDLKLNSLLDQENAFWK